MKKITPISKIIMILLAPLVFYESWKVLNEVELTNVDFILKIIIVSGGIIDIIIFFTTKRISANSKTR